MSTQIEPANLPLGAPELTPLGKRIEMLRIQRGLSKQHLARHAGTSRQQLWRVMTGKSELSSPLRHRLTDVLGVDVAGPLAASVLLSPLAPEARGRDDAGHVAPAAPPARTAPVPPVDLDAWLADPRRIEASLRTLPIGSAGRRIKRALLDLVEDLAAEQRLPVSASFLDLRRRVLNGEL